MLKILTFSTSALVFAVTLTTASPSAAQTASHDTQLSMKVPYGDLNLANEIGRQRLISRVHNAADTVCATNPAHSGLTDRQLTRACLSVAMNDAMPQVYSAFKKAELRGTVTVTENDQPNSEAAAILVSTAR